MKIYECRYVKRGTPGDLLMGWTWLPAIFVVEAGEHEPANPYESIRWHEERMFDKETGENVGDTLNFCTNEHCSHEDCAPTTLIFSDEGNVIHCAERFNMPELDYGSDC